MDPSVAESLDCRRLFYLSSHILDSKNVAAYGKNRILRELLDAWCDRKLTYAGVVCDDTPSQLTDDELASIPGSEVLRSADALKLEVTVRNGSCVEIHPDQVKLWTTTKPFDAEFASVLEEHNRDFKDILAEAGVLTSKDGTVVAMEDPGVNNQEPGQVPETELPKLNEFESEEKLNAADNVKFRAVSEVSDVELLRTASGKTYLLSKKMKTLARHLIIAGYGTGKLPGLLFQLELSLCDCCASAGLSLLRVMRLECLWSGTLETGLLSKWTCPRWQTTTRTLR